MSAPSFDRHEAMLGFNPVDFIDDVIHVVNEVALEGIDDLESKLKRLYKDHPQDVKEGCDQVERLFRQHIDVYFDKWELYLLNNVMPLRLPSAALPLKPHEKERERQSQIRKRKRTVQQLAGEVGELQREVAAKRYMIEKIKEEIGKSKSDAVHLETLRKNLSTLHPVSEIHDQYTDVLESVETLHNLTSKQNEQDEMEDAMDDEDVYATYRKHRKDAPVV